MKPSPQAVLKPGGDLLPTYEVRLQVSDAKASQARLLVDAENWFAALQASLQNLGEPLVSPRSLQVEVHGDGWLNVFDALQPRSFLVRELSATEAAATQAPHLLRASSASVLSATVL